MAYFLDYVYRTVWEWAWGSRVGSSLSRMRITSCHCILKRVSWSLSPGESVLFVVREGGKDSEEPTRKRNRLEDHLQEVNGRQDWAQAFLGPLVSKNSCSPGPLPVCCLFCYLTPEQQMDSVLTVLLQVREQESQGPQRKLLREPGLEPRLVHLTLDNFDCVVGILLS